MFLLTIQSCYPLSQLIHYLICGCLLFLLTFFLTKLIQLYRLGDRTTMQHAGRGSRHLPPAIQIWHSAKHPTIKPVLSVIGSNL